MAIGETVKAPLYALGADGDYHKMYIENVAEQVVGLGRRPNTAYTAGDVVSCSTNNQLNLVCTTAGTTATTDLDISSKNVGDTITDGTVVWSCFSRMQAGVPVGFEFFSTNPNIPAGSIPLFGGEYSRTVYKDLWNWVQTQAGYLLTEEEWQAKASANEGNVPFYSSGDGSTTFRVPSLKCWIKGANGIEEVGSYLQAGLPNITGGSSDNDYKAPRMWTNGGMLGKGAIISYTLAPQIDYAPSGGASYGQFASFDFDASRSNTIYGNSDTVQPKSIAGMWLVKAYGTVTNVGSTDVANIAQGLTEAETRISAIEDNKVDKAGNAWVVETYNDGTNWYRKWSDGWLEQGGCFAGRFSNVTTITYPLPFSQVYTVLKTNRVTTSYNQSLAYDWFAVVDATNINFKSASAQDVGIYWYACGQGA